uniref:PiggyBac transposable element-derived protein domain-containing protein n=1 Tax=Monopterus albus TaxID=43700 RepID=A0A3Q3JHS1_MONAL|nr:piggyBac transposable element-derived protein 4-like [Monopterus albus]
MDFTELARCRTRNEDPSLTDHNYCKTGIKDESHDPDFIDQHICKSEIKEENQDSELMDQGLHQVVIKEEKHDSIFIEQDYYKIEVKEENQDRDLIDQGHHKSGMNEVNRDQDHRSSEPAKSYRAGSPSGPSDQQGPPESGDDNDSASVDSVEELPYSDKAESFLSSDSDVDWEPDTKRTHTSLHSTSEESSDDDLPLPKAAGETLSRGRGRGKEKQAKPSSSTANRWHGVEDDDAEPPQPVFRPARIPGPQLKRTASYTPLQLFQLFFSSEVMRTVLANTNRYGAKRHEGRNNNWRKVSLQELCSYLALVIYMGLVKCTALTDYWRTSQLYKLPLPASLMSLRRFLGITAALHLSDPKVDAENEQKRGTAAFDGLCKIKPIYPQIVEACKTHFHPTQSITVDERMVTSRVRSGLKRYMKNKPTKWDYKLFVLADSSCGYTWNFFVYESKAVVENGKGLNYDSVMNLLDEKLLGTGYKLFVDNFFTSPSLFRDLLQNRIWACGTMRPFGLPKTVVNSMPSNAPRGTVRWIREDGLLFVKWKDTREVLLCSTFHRAFEGDTVQRQVRGDDGQWSVVNIPVPAVVKEYKRGVGAMDISDALISYYNILHKTKKWYKTFFYHFVDIAVVNAFILHRHMRRANGDEPMTQKAFRETLVLELGACSHSLVSTSASTSTPTSASAKHRPKYISEDSKTRRRCRRCHQKTPYVCLACMVPFCMQPQRDCFNDWHDEQGL